MDSRCFIFDLVILNVWVPEFDYENNCLSVEVCFNETEFTIEQNQEKPGEFKQGRTCEFKAYPDELKNELLDHPLKLKVHANQTDCVGMADVAWPPDLLQKLESENFMQYSHFDQCDLMVNNMNTGKVGIQYRLRAKCQPSETDEDEEEKHYDIQGELKKIVNPNEVFFLIQNDSDACSVMNANEKNQPTCPTALDLSKFKDFHGKVVRDPGEFDQVYSLDCCHTKKYGPDSKVASACMNATPRQDRAKCDESQSSMQWACKATKHVRECPHSNKFSDETTGSCSCDCDKDQNIFQNGKMKNICALPESPPVLKDTLYVRPKACPVCSNDVSWLPKMAACPKCGHKPTPYAVERPYNENMTAEQILKEWTNENPVPNQCNDKKKDKSSNRCSCKNGKVCAYCRIRKLCKDAIKNKKCNVKGSTDSGGSLKDTPHKICKSNSDAESRTYLERVFSELRDLYNLKPDSKQRGFVEHKSCEKSFNVETKRKHKSKAPSRSRIAPPSNQRIKQKADLTKPMTGETKAKWCKGKIYNYKAVRNYPGTLIGHKTCVSSGKSVPRNMGWLWNTDTVGIRRGWKPGAIRKPIKEIMKYFLKDFPVDSLRVSRYARKAVTKKESEELVQKPTLQICKKNGVYIITMRPLKDASLLKDCADPYVEMKPIRFKIVKNPLLVYASEMKKILKKQFTKCTCHKPVSTCYCRRYLDKRRLEFELCKLCRQKGIPNLKDTLVLSDTTDSEMEFDFGVTPPAGVIKPQLKHRPDLACRETQYCDKDWVLKPCFPMTLNKYMKPYDSTGGRIIIENDEETKPRGKGKGGKGGAGGAGGGNGPSGRQGVGAFAVGGAFGAAFAGPPKGPPFVAGAGAAPGIPLFCNLARRRKAGPCSCGPPPCVPCMPIC